MWFVCVSMWCLDSKSKKKKNKNKTLPAVVISACFWHNDSWHVLTFWMQAWECS